MGLNKEQQKAFTEIINFINNPNKKYMNISGGAGTGKTYFIAEILSTILKYKDKNCFINDVHVTATTNKAAAVISETLSNKSNKPKEVNTVYSFMNLRVKENFRTGMQNITTTRAWKVQSNILLIIDECSMVNKELFKYLEMGLNKTCKILFIGDKNQLSPVKESISPVYQKNHDTFYLTKPMRNGDQPALIELCEQLKQTVLTGIFTPIKEIPGVIDFVNGTQLKGILEREYLVEDINKRILCYTNERAIEYGDFIRELRDYSFSYEIGENVCNNSSIELPNKIRLYADQVFKITKINSKYLQFSNMPMSNITIQDVNTLVQYDVNVFNNFSDRVDLMKHFAYNKNWLKYFDIKNTYPDLRSFVSSTIHKAQGSTYDSVIVDLANIGKCTNREQTARMQYVALSRAKNRVFIRGELPNRYFN